jgi:hypothetical protein
MSMTNCTTLALRVTIESDVSDCYDLRDAVAASILGIKEICGSETDVRRHFRFLISEVDMPKAGKYRLFKSRKPT